MKSKITSNIKEQKLGHHDSYCNVFEGPGYLDYYRLGMTQRQFLFWN